jgi:hypothetical protein
VVCSRCSRKCKVPRNCVAKAAVLGEDLQSFRSFEPSWIWLLAPLFRRRRYVSSMSYDELQSGTFSKVYVVDYVINISSVVRVLEATLRCRYGYG